MEVTLSSGFASMRTANLCALYCNKVVLPSDLGSYMTIEKSKPLKKKGHFRGTGKIRSVYKTISDDIRSDLRLFIDEGIFEEAENAHIDDCYAFEDAFLDLLGTISDTPGWETYLEHHASLVDSSTPTLHEFISFLSASAYQTSIRYDRPILTDNFLVNSIILKTLGANAVSRIDQSKARSAMLTNKVLSEYLPDINEVSPEAILEVRHRFSDELGALKAKMQSISAQIRSTTWDHEIQDEIRRLVETEIKPETHNLKLALQTSNLQLVYQTFKNLKDVKTYIPFAGSVLGHFEPAVAAMASAGVAGFDALYQTIIERRKIRDESGLVFLLDGPKSLNHTNWRLIP